MIIITSTIFLILLLSLIPFWKKIISSSPKTKLQPKKSHKIGNIDKTCSNGTPLLSNSTYFILKYVKQTAPQFNITTSLSFNSYSPNFQKTIHPPLSRCHSHIYSYYVHLNKNQGNQEIRGYKQNLWILWNLFFLHFRYKNRYEQPFLVCRCSLY